MRFFLRFSALIVALGLAQPCLGQNRAPSDTSGKTESRDEAKKDKPHREKPPPIAFFLAKGEPGSCGPGCSEWIAADGTFDTKAAERFRAFLKRFGKQVPPIYFHSPGGSLSDSMVIGRLMRERGMRAGIGRTIPRGCDPTQDREAICDELKRSGRELLAELRTIDTLCNSACVYALIGGAQREVAPGARLGVHTMAFAEKNLEGVLTSREGPLTRLEQEQLKMMKARLARYIADMGIEEGLFKAADEVTHDRVRYISRDEIARFGIDRRDFQESRWTPNEGRSFAIYKFITEGRGEPKTYRTTRIRLACTRSREIGVQLSRELTSAAAAGGPVAMTSAAGDIVLPPGRGKPTLGYNDILMEDRYTVAPPSFFEEAARGESIELIAAGRAPGEDAPRPMKISTAGLASAVKALLQSCR